MTIAAKRLLVAMPTMMDPNFSRTVIALIEHSADEGAIGVIVNRPTDIDVTEHLPWLQGAVCDPGTVFVGGPVQREVAIGLHRSPDGSPAIVEDLESPPPGPLRVFSGYSGWGAGQLESELEEDTWVVVDQEPDDAFDPEPATLWSRVLRRQAGVVAMLASYPIDLSSN